MNTTNRWLILALLFVARTGLGFQFQTLGSVSPQLVDELGLNYREVGTLIGLFTLAGVFLSIPIGMAFRFASERTLVAAGLLSLAAGGGIAAVAAGFDLIALGRLLCGVGFVLSTIYFTKMIADWFEGKELATALSILVMSWPIGIAFGQVLHSWLAVTFGWRTAFGVAAIYCLAGAMLVGLFYRTPPKAAATVPPAVNRLTSKEWQLTLIASAVWALFNAGYIVYLSFAEHLLVDGGLSSLKASAIASLPSWVMIVAAIFAGRHADRHGTHDQILYICMAAAIVSLLLLPFTSFAIPIVLLFGLSGMAPAGIIVALTGQSMSAEARAFGMGVFFAAYFFIVTPVPAIAGWLFDLTGDAHAPIVFAAALFAATALTNILFRLVQQRSGARV